MQRKLWKWAGAALAGWFVLLLWVGVGTAAGGAGTPGQAAAQPIDVSQPAVQWRAAPSPSPTVSPTSTSTRGPKPIIKTATPTPSPTATPAFLPRVPKADGEPADVVIRGNGGQNCVAITFDMAPYGTAEATDGVLDALARSKVRSTFFVTGEWLEAFPEHAARLAREGHELANHSYNHPHFTEIGGDQMLWQIEHTEDLVRSIAGAEPAPYFRPPFGDYNDRVLRVIGGAGYYFIYWTLDSADWQPSTTADDVVRRVLRLTEPGDIVVMHGYVDKTATALPAIIDGLRSQGICLDTLTGLLR